MLQIPASHGSHYEKLLSFGCGAAQYDGHVEERVASIFKRECIPEDDGNRLLRNASIYPPTARGNTGSAFDGERLLAVVKSSTLRNIRCRH
jgi:hypothetical protein